MKMSLASERGFFERSILVIQGFKLGYAPPSLIQRSEELFFGFFRILHVG